MSHLLRRVRLPVISLLWMHVLKSVTAYEFDAYSGKRGWLEDHNYFRCLHGAPPVEWDNELAKRSEDWVQQLSSLREPQHSDSFNNPPPSAESIMWFTGRASKFCRQMEQDYNQHCAVLGWYMEYDEFYRCHSDIDWWTLDIKNIGHFSSLVWHNIDRIGCAQYGDFFVCNYGHSKCRKRPNDDYTCLWNNPDATLLPNVNLQSRCSTSYDHCIKCRDDDKLRSGTCGPQKVQLNQPYGHAMDKPLTASSWDKVARELGIDAVNYNVHGDELSKLRDRLDVVLEPKREKYTTQAPTTTTTTKPTTTATTRSTTTKTTTTTTTRTTTRRMTTTRSTTKRTTTTTERTRTTARPEPEEPIFSEESGGGGYDKMTYQERHVINRHSRGRSNSYSRRRGGSGHYLAADHDATFNGTMPRLTFGETFDLLRDGFQDDELVPADYRRNTQLNSRIRVHADASDRSADGQGVWARIAARSHATVSEISYILTVLLPFTF